MSLCLKVMKGSSQLYNGFHLFLYFFLIGEHLHSQTFQGSLPKRFNLL